MSEEQHGPAATAKKAAPRRARTQGLRHGQLVRLRFGPDAPLTTELFNLSAL
jgi:hypothetical protein